MAITESAPMSYQEALASADPFASLRGAVARDLQVRPARRETVYGELDALRLTLRSAGREREEDAVMDVMDCLTGYCSPHERL